MSVNSDRITRLLSQRRVGSVIDNWAQINDKWWQHTDRFKCSSSSCGVVATDRTELAVLQSQLLDKKQHDVTTS